MSVVYYKKRDAWCCGTTKEIADGPKNNSGLNGIQAHICTILRASTNKKTCGLSKTSLKGWS